jgi:hypothetical protein
MNVVMNISVAPQVKALAAEAARADRRSVSALLEILILENCPKIIESRRDIQMIHQSSAVNRGRQA